MAVMLPLKDTKDLLYIKVRALVIQCPCGKYNHDDDSFIEFAADITNKICCPECKYELFDYDCMLTDNCIINSVDLHMLRYHREKLNPDVILVLRQITGVID